MTFQRWLHPPTGAPVPPSAVPAVRVHTVTTPPGSRGASLAGIAEDYLGDRLRWVDLYNLNRHGVPRRDGTVGFMTTTEDLAYGDRVYLP